jgi:hypothetical protein
MPRIKCKAFALFFALAGLASVSSYAQQKTVNGYLRADIFFNKTTANSVAGTKADPRFPNNPTEVRFLKYFEFPPGADDGTPPPGNVYDNYGDRLWGWLTPKQTAEYIFFVAADDPAELWLSTDETEANKKLVASEPQWNGVRAWVATSRRPGCPDNGGTQCENRSNPIRLEAGKRYFVEAIHSEGLGGDNVAVTWIKKGDPDPEAGALPIGSEFLSSVADTTLKITVDPVGTVRDEGQTATFSVSHNSLGPNAPIAYQWRKNGAPVAGATSQTYTSAKLVAADNDAKISVVLSAGGQSVTSKDATLTVLKLGPLIVVPGFAKMEIYKEISGNPVQNLLDSPKYPASPDEVVFLAGFNSRSALPSDSLEAYGARISAWVTPVESGQYEFFIRSDDASQLFVSTDDKAANLALVAEETGCCGAFEETGAAETSAPIQLTAGRRYLVQALYKEGGGGDFCQVAWRKVGDKTAAGALAPIPPGFLSYEMPSKGSVAITTQPANATAQEGKNATFTVEYTSTHGPVAFQWQKNGANLSAGTSKTLSIGPVTSADNGAKLKVIVSVPGAVTTSSEATLTVTGDTTPPVPFAGALKKGNNQEIGIGFDEPVDAASVGAAANYTISAGKIDKVEVVTRSLAGFSPDLPSKPIEYSGVKLIVSGLTAGQPYKVSVKGVKDTKGNAITSAVDVPFTAEASKTYTVVGANESGFANDAVRVGDQGFDIISSGVAFWSDYDEATFVNEPIRGDFDKIAQLEYQDPSSQWSRCGLMAREALDEGKARPERGACTQALETDGTYCVPKAQLFSRFQTVHANPTIRWDAGVANNAYENHWRAEDTFRRDFGNQMQSADGGFGPMNYPNVWMRLKREGNFLITFRSTDGKVWNQMTRREFANLAPTLFVGPFLAPELLNNGTKDGLGHSVLAKFRNYRDFGTTTPPPGSKLAFDRTATGLRLTFSGTLQSADSVTGPWTDVTGASSPASITFTGAGKFYRTKQ